MLPWNQSFAWNDSVFFFLVFCFECVFLLLLFLVIIFGEIGPIFPALEYTFTPTPSFIQKFPSLWVLNVSDSYS